MASNHDEIPETLTAACVQFDVRRGDVDGNLRRAEAGIAAAAAQGARLCVLPEMWSTSFLPDYDPATLAAATAAEDRLRQWSGQHGLVTVGSSVVAADGAVHNCAHVHDRGVTIGTYRKLHMFSPNAEQRHHAPGDTPLVVDSSAGRLGVLIGYDLRFPELARYYFHKGVEVLTVPAQWPEARSQHWRTLLRARAIENITFAIGCNRVGQDASLKNEDELSYPGDGRIIDPTGEVLVAGSGGDEPLVAELELRTARTMRRILPVDRDQRPTVYRRLCEDVWESMIAASRESGDGESPANGG
ncbi:MAG: nitrilase-related carbon-nitrogen hydrolase [Planctomycetota bacterium]